MNGFDHACLVLLAHDEMAVRIDTWKQPLVEEMHLTLVESVVAIDAEKWS